MTLPRKKLIAISQKVLSQEHLSPMEIQSLLTFEHETKTSSLLSYLKHMAVPASFIAGFFLAAFADFFKQLTSQLPSWTNLSPQLLAGVDYIWDFLGEPIAKENMLYHIPNIVLYTFGIAEIKTFIDTLNHRTWLKKVVQAQTLLRENIEKGQLHLQMKKGHSLLFVGKGDFIGTQFTLNHKDDETVTISEIKPTYTNYWNYYDIASLYENLKDVIHRSHGENAGEYIFFPVEDNQIFLPNETAYDLSPYKIDIICQNIRNIEKELQVEPKRIIIIGDKYHTSYVHSEDKEHIIKNSEDIISLKTICNKYSKVTLLDPSDIVLKKILEIAKERKIIFRATEQGIKEYKKRFYDRIVELGYEDTTQTEGILTIGYDMFEEQTEQQTLSGKIDSYFPVVLSKNVSDALIRNGYKKNEFLYVPDLVIEKLSQVADEQ